MEMSLDHRFDFPFVTLVFGWQTYGEVDFAKIDKVIHDIDGLLSEQRQVSGFLNDLLVDIQRELGEFNDRHRAWIDLRRLLDIVRDCAEERVKLLEDVIEKLASSLRHGGDEINAMLKVQSNTRGVIPSDSYGHELIKYAFEQLKRAGLR